MTMLGDVTEQEFDEKVLKSDTPVLVDFWADWCVPCHMVSPVVEEIASEQGDKLHVMKLNIDFNADAAQRYGVMSIPTLLLFKGGEAVARVVGAQGKEKILSQITPHL